MFVSYPRDLNKALIHHHHPMLTVEEVAQMSGATIFSVNAKSFFAGQMDDIIIGGHRIEEHDKDLRKVLNQARHVKLRLN